MTTRLFILDDEAPARQRMRMLLSDIAIECPTVVVGEAERAQGALDAIASCQPDIVLLDVQMPGMNGIEFAGQLQQTLSADLVPTVIFVSAFDSYAIQAFEVHAFDYLMKPVRATRLKEAILRAMRVRGQLAEAKLAHDAAAEASTSSRDTFSVLERGKILLVPVRDVLYIKAEQKYLTLHTKRQQYLIEQSLQAIENDLPDVFLRIHRNTLIARAALVGVERGMELDEQSGKMTEAWQVILRDCNDRLPISRRLWPSVKALVK